MKYIYLDQNKWIELAKGIKQENSKYIELYNTIINNVENGIWAFPLSIIHITETMKRKDEASRKEILDLMFSVSKGYAICDYATADYIEFKYWVNNKASDFSELKPIMIRQDYANIISLSMEKVFLEFGKMDGLQPNELEILKQEIKKYYSERDVFDKICHIAERDIIKNEEFYYNCFEEGRQGFLKWKESIKKLDVYKEKHLYPAYLLHTFFELYKSRLEKLSPEMKNNVSEMISRSTKNKTMTIANLEALPGFNVYNRLIFELFNNPDKEVHKHDFNDIAYLRVAVPYCDIVIGENYWCNRVCHYKLDEKYKTIVKTCLFELLNY